MGRSKAGGGDWVGGYVPLEVDSRPVGMFLWLDVGAGTILAMEAKYLDEKGTRPIVEAFATACERARPPRRVRVSTDSLAADLRAAGLGLDVVVGETPEVEEAFVEFTEYLQSQEEGEGSLEPPAGPRAGRNDPCPCGSGKKYKRCHLAEDEREGGTLAAAADEPPPSPIHAFDLKVQEKLFRFAQRRFPEELEALFVQLLGDVSERASPDVLEGQVPFVVYQGELRGRPIVEWFLEREGRSVTPRERAHLAAQASAWLSIWEVREVETGMSLLLRDLLTGAERRVHERQAALQLQQFQAILARVVDFEGESLLVGVHAYPLPPLAAHEVVKRVRRWLESPGLVPPERLRGTSFAAEALRLWEVRAGALIRELSRPPDIRNTDGDALLVTTDVFDVKLGSLAPGRDPEADVLSRLAALPGAEVSADEERTVLFARAERSDGLPGGTLLGRATVEGGRLRVSANSVERADQLRASVEGTLGELVRHRGRSHEDPLSSASLESSRPPTGEPIPEEAREAILQMQRHAQVVWLDEAVPALRGRTPRQAARTKPGRERLVALLKEMEILDSRRPPGAPPWDFDVFRRELGLDPL